MVLLPLGLSDGCSVGAVVRWEYLGDVAACFFPKSVWSSFLLGLLVFPSMVPSGRVLESLPGRQPFAEGGWTPFWGCLLPASSRGLVHVHLLCGRMGMRYVAAFPSLSPYSRGAPLPSTAAGVPGRCRWVCRILPYKWK